MVVAISVASCVGAQGALGKRGQTTGCRFEEARCSPSSCSRKAQTATLDEMGRETGGPKLPAVIVSCLSLNRRRRSPFFPSLAPSPSEDPDS